MRVALSLSFNGMCSQRAKVEGWIGELRLRLAAHFATLAVWSVCIRKVEIVQSVALAPLEGQYPGICALTSCLQALWQMLWSTWCGGTRLAEAARHPRRQQQLPQAQEVLRLLLPPHKGPPQPHQGLPQQLQHHQQVQQARSRRWVGQICTIPWALVAWADWEEWGPLGGWEVLEDWAPGWTVERGV